LAINGTGLCKVCAEKQTPVETEDEIFDQIDGTRTMSKMDVLRFAKVDTEMRNHHQGARIAELEIKILKDTMLAEVNALQLRYRDQIRNKNSEREQLLASAQALRPEYNSLLAELADRYGISDRSKMAIDTDVGTIRELTD
jgi:hypothetical protein